MGNKAYIEKVIAGDFPKENAVPLDEPFVDERGAIQNLWLGPSNSVTLITSKKGTIRANHYHKNDWHAAYIVSGSLKYYERDIEGKHVKDPVVFKAGQMVFSKPEVVHKMEFLEDTTFITINGIVKNHENYEDSVVRLEF